MKTVMGTGGAVGADTELKKRTLAACSASLTELHLLLKEKTDNNSKNDVGLFGLEAKHIPNELMGLKMFLHGYEAASRKAGQKNVGKDDKFVNETVKKLFASVRAVGGTESVQKLADSVLDMTKKAPLGNRSELLLGLAGVVSSMTSEQRTLYWSEVSQASSGFDASTKKNFSDSIATECVNGIVDRQEGMNFFEELFKSMEDVSDTRCDRSFLDNCFVTMVNECPDIVEAVEARDTTLEDVSMEAVSVETASVERKARTR